MKNMRSVILLSIALACCLLYVGSSAQNSKTSAQTAEGRELQSSIFLVDHAWRFSYSFPSPPDGVPPVQGSFRFVLNGHQIEGYEDGSRGPRLVLRGTTKQDSFNDIAWEINFGAVGGQNDPSAGQDIWGCAKHTRFGQWIPTSLSISADQQTISFQYPILEAGAGNKVEQCREVPVLYRISRRVMR